MKKTNFQQHRQYKKGYKMLVRFFIYGIVIAVLLYLINNQNKGQSSSDENRPDQINNFEISVD